MVLKYLFRRSRGSGTSCKERPVNSQLVTVCTLLHSGPNLKLKIDSRLFIRKKRCLNNTHILKRFIEPKPWGVPYCRLQNCKMRKMLLECPQLLKALSSSPSHLFDPTHQRGDPTHHTHRPFHVASQPLYHCIFSMLYIFGRKTIIQSINHLLLLLFIIK